MYPFARSCVLAVGLTTAARADIPVELPCGADPDDWAAAFEAARELVPDLVVGTAGSTGPSIRVVEIDQDWVLRVRSTMGTCRDIVEPVRATAEGRSDLLWYAAYVLKADDCGAALGTWWSRAGVEAVFRENTAGAVGLRVEQGLRIGRGAHLGFSATWIGARDISDTPYEMPRSVAVQASAGWLPGGGDAVRPLIGLSAGSGFRRVVRPDPVTGDAVEAEGWFPVVSVETGAAVPAARGWTLEPTLRLTAELGTFGVDRPATDRLDLGGGAAHVGCSLRRRAPRRPGPTRTYNRRLFVDSW